MTKFKTQSRVQFIAPKKDGVPGSFGKPQDDYSRHSERICVRTECNESGLREYRVVRAVRLENEAIRAWSKFKTLVSGSIPVKV